MIISLALRFDAVLRLNFTDVLVQFHLILDFTRNSVKDGFLVEKREVVQENKWGEEIDR